MTLPAAKAQQPRVQTCNQPSPRGDGSLEGVANRRGMLRCMTLGAIVVPLVGLFVGLGGMWLAWKLVVQLPQDEHSTSDDDGEAEAGEEGER